MRLPGRGRPRCAGLPLPPSCCWWRQSPWAATARATSCWRRGLTDACASRGVPNKGRTVLRIWKAGRPTGSFDFDAPPPLASALRPAGGWPHCQGSPGYGLGHDDERQNRKNGPVKSQKDPQAGGVDSGRERNYERNYKVTIYHVISLLK